MLEGWLYSVLNDILIEETQYYWQFGKCGPILFVYFDLAGFLDLVTFSVRPNGLT